MVTAPTRTAPNSPGEQDTLTMRHLLATAPALAGLVVVMILASHLANLARAVGL